jgi:hypothetical protein
MLCVAGSSMAWPFSNSFVPGSCALIVDIDEHAPITSAAPINEIPLIIDFKF